MKGILSDKDGSEKLFSINYSGSGLSIEELVIKKGELINKLIFIIPKLSNVELLIHTEFKDSLIDSVETDFPAK
jgi:hypothetical protein